MGRAAEKLKPKHGKDSSLQRIFPEGSVVEVQTDEEDFQGVSFLANIIASSPISKEKGRKTTPNKLHVEYHNLLVHEGRPERLREYVDVSSVKPHPPPLEEVSGFEISDTVDAFYNDGWWTGAVTRVVEGGRFIVTFQHPPDELEFGLSDLRVHWDWCHGSWVRSEKQAMAASMFDVGRKVEVAFDSEDSQGAWFPATIEKVLRKGAFLVEYSNLRIDNGAEILKVTVDSLHIRPCPPSFEKKNYILLEKVDSFFHFGWWSGVITRVFEDSRYAVFFKQTKQVKEFHQSDLRPHLEWRDGKWFNPFLSQDVLCQTSVIENLSCPSSENDGGNTVAVSPVCCSEDCSNSLHSVACLQKLHENHIEPSLPSVHKFSHDAKSLEEKLHSSDTCNVLSSFLKKAEEGILPGACQQDIADRCEELLISSSVNDLQIIPSQHVAGDHFSDNLSLRQMIVNGTSMQLRKLRKLDRKDYSTSRSPNKSRKPKVELERSERDVGGREKHEMESAAEDVRNDHAEKEDRYATVIGSPSVERDYEFGMSRGKRAICHSNYEEVMKFKSDQKEKLNCPATETKKKSKQCDSGDLRRKQQRGWPPKKSCANTQIAEISPASTVEQCMENNDNVERLDVSEKKRKRTMDLVAFVDTGAVMHNEQKDLPFVKNNTLWKAIESMHVFHRMPQRPHFQPLIHVKETSREGLAVGYMVTFSTVVENASRMRISDPSIIIDDIVETLADLEKYGFDVRVVEDCLNQMLALKHKQEDLGEKRNEIYRQITQQQLEKQRINEEITDMEKQILKLQKKISLASSLREKDDKETTSLKSKLLEVEESMKIMEQEFEELGASLKTF